MGPPEEALSGCISVMKLGQIDHIPVHEILNKHRAWTGLELQNVAKVQCKDVSEWIQNQYHQGSQGNGPCMKAKDLQSPETAVLSLHYRWLQMKILSSQELWQEKW